MRLACNLGVVVLLALVALLVLPCGCGQQAATPLQGFVPAMAGDLALKVPAAWQRVETKSPMQKGEWRLPGNRSGALLALPGGCCSNCAVQRARFCSRLPASPPNV